MKMMGRVSPSRRTWLSILLFVSLIAAATAFTFLAARAEKQRANDVRGWIKAEGGMIATGPVVESRFERLVTKVLGNDVETPITYVAFEDRKLRNSDIIHLSKLPHLRSLDLKGCSISPSVLLAISELDLVGLHVSNTNVDDDALQAISRMSSLRELDLSSTAITAEGIHHLRKLNQLAFLYIRDVAISSTEKEALKARFPDVIVFLDSD